MYFGIEQIHSRQFDQIFQINLSIFGKNLALSDLDIQLESCGLYSVTPDSSTDQ